MNFLLKLKKFLEKHSFLFLVIAVIIYIISFSFLTLKKLDYFAYNNFDLAIFNQVFFNTIHGRWLEMTVNLNNYIADHFTPFIIFLLPFYALKPGPETLLVMQSFILAISALPLYFISHRVTKNKILSLGIALAWLLNPFIHQVNFTEVHLEVVMASLFFIIFYFYYLDKFGYFLLFFILTLLVREDMALFLLGFPLLALFEKRNWRWTFLPILLSISYFLFAVKVIDIFSVHKQYKFFIYYGWLGGSDAFSIAWSFVSHPWQVLRHIFKLENITSVLVVLWPMLFLPLYKSKYLLLSAVPFVLTLLTGSGFSSLVYHTHYILFVLPGIFIAFIFALADLQQHKYYQYIIILLSVTVIYLAIFLGPVKNFLAHQFDTKIIDYKRQLVNQIPPEAKVAVSSDFLPALSSRQYVYPLNYAFFGYSQFLLEPFVLPQVDYLFIDFEDFMIDVVAKEGKSFLTEHKEVMNENWHKTLSDYDLISVEKNIFFFKKKTEGQQNLFLSEVVDFSKTDNNKDLLLGHNFFAKDNVLEIFVDTNLFVENALIRFYSKDSYFDFPLDYAMFSKKFLEPDKAIKLHYYLPADVESFEIFSWTGENMVSLINNAVPVFQLELLQSKIILKR